MLYNAWHCLQVSKSSALAQKLRAPQVRDRTGARALSLVLSSALVACNLAVCCRVLCCGVR
eukprot:2599689-Rhodomonas_salina.1